MSSNPGRLEFLFKKYLKGSCNRQELDEFWILLSELSDDERLSVGLSETWKADDLETRVKKEKWDEIYYRVRDKIGKQKVQYSAVRKLSLKKYWAAAILAGILISGYLVYTNLHQSADRTQVVSSRQIFEPHQTDIQVVTLPDGSVVTLRKNGKLSYDSSFNGNQRVVNIEGEAFFDVAHDTTRPFIVHSGSYSIKVLGTAFNVNTTKNKLEVTVARGKVKVETTDNHKAIGVLTPGKQLLIDRPDEDDEKLSVKESIDADAVTNWVKQDLIFRNDDWAAAARIIYNKYGVHVKLENEDLDHCRFTGDFTNNSLDDCLDILCALTNTTWRKDGTSTIFINGKGCQ